MDDDGSSGEGRLDAVGPSDGAGSEGCCEGIARALFRFQILLLNFTMQKEDSSSHQNTGKCMKY
jgi:hypothetical protein